MAAPSCQFAGALVALYTVAAYVGRPGSIGVGVLFDAATNWLQPAALADGQPPVPMASATAVVVLAAWTVIPLALGAWRTQTRDA